MIEMLETGRPWKFTQRLHMNLKNKVPNEMIWPCWLLLYALIPNWYIILTVINQDRLAHAVLAS
jgi:hypothetical protein